MKKAKFSKLLSVGLVFSIACGGGNKVLISQSEIDSARSSGSLEKLYSKASGLVAESKGSSRKEAVALQSKIANLLIADAGKEIDELIVEAGKEDSQVTRKQLIVAKDSITNMQQWSATEYARYATKIDKVIGDVNKRIDNLIQESNDSGLDSVSKILKFKQAALLAGEGEEEHVKYQKDYAQAIEQLSYQGNDGLNKRLYSMALEAAKSALRLDPGNIQFESMQSQAQAGLFEKDFRFALENGKPESAFQSLVAVADEPIFLQLKKSMGKSITLLANYFANNAAKNYQSGNLVAAYDNFQKGRIIQDKLGVSSKGFIQEKKFLDLVMARAKNVESGIGKRQALLRVINEFDPAYPSLSSEMLKLSDEIKSRALTKLSVAEFKEVQTSDSVASSVGRRIGSKLEKILFEKLGNEVLIVTEAQANQGNGYQGLALKIDGEVLQAAIETQVNKGQRSINVKTGVNRVETEEYKDWSKRKRGEAPKQFNESPIMEDIVLTVEHIRKQSIAEVAFRIIEPATGKILLTDNFVKEGQFAGESINEYQKGDFHQPYMPADLPSDIKIMDSLASELAEMLGSKLGDYLQNPEQVFHHKFVEAKAQNNLNGSIELLANALLIAENKGQDKSEWLSEIKKLSLQ